MENNQPTNPFDSMLKQSLEGAQMPVPTGVWEAVGSSIGAKAIVAAKATTIKLLLIKSVAAVVITGGLALGVYQIFKPEPTPEPKIIPNVSITSPNEITSETPLEAPFSRFPENERTHPILKDTLEFPNKSLVYTTDLMDTVKDILNEANSTSNQSNENTKSDKGLGEKHDVLKETPKKVEPGAKKEVVVPVTETETPHTEKPFSAKDIFIPNVFTPYTKDGANDSFKIVIENEKLFILQIYSTDNKKVFESTDKRNAWDGKNMNSGQMCPKGYYIYKLIFELKTGYKETRRGELNLL